MAKHSIKSIINDKHAIGSLSLTREGGSLSTSVKDEATVKETMMPPCLRAYFIIIIIIFGWPKLMIKIFYLFVVACERLKETNWRIRNTQKAEE
jgi:hypothetical protein